MDEPMRKGFVIPENCDDEEIIAMYIIKQVFEPLEKEARLRVLCYFHSREKSGAADPGGEEG